MSSDPRYPYTHAADYLRDKTAEWSEVRGVSLRLPTLSRAQAAGARHAIAAVLGMDDRELACKLADAFLLEQRTFEASVTKGASDV